MTQDSSAGEAPAPFDKAPPSSPVALHRGTSRGGEPWISTPKKIGNTPSASTPPTPRRISDERRLRDRDHARGLSSVSADAVDRRARSLLCAEVLPDQRHLLAGVRRARDHLLPRRGAPKGRPPDLDDR